MVVGGENLRTALAAAVSTQLHDQVELYNEYGPTEAVVGCVRTPLRPRDATPAASVPIGVPADHVTVEVLNEAQVPVPEGVPGELWISRFGLARGYHGLDDLTAECFQPHPQRPGERRYRTGDLVRMVDPEHPRVSRPPRPPAQDLGPPRRARRNRNGSALPADDRGVRRGRTTEPLDAAGGARRDSSLRPVRSALELPAGGLRLRGRLQRVPLVRVDQGPRAGLLQDRGRPARNLRRVRPPPSPQIRLHDALQRRQGQHLRPVPAG